MSAHRPFRFGVVAPQVRSAEDWVAKARRETLGFSYVLVAEFFMEAFAPVVERLAGR